jgi:ATP-dependent DNA helicase RecG
MYQGRDKPYQTNQSQFLIRLGASYARNPVIVSLLQQMGYIDKLGRGLPMVIREIRNLNKQLEFQELGEEFVVTIAW